MKTPAATPRKTRLVTPKLTVLECDVMQELIQEALAKGWSGDRAIVAARAGDKLKCARADARKG
jgi:hypothetical protein